LQFCNSGMAARCSVTGSGFPTSSWFCRVSSQARHPAAAGVIARRRQKLTARLPRAGTAVRVPVRGGHHALERPARKGRDSPVVAWRGVHAAYRGVVREHWLATRSGSPPRSAKGTPGRGGNVASLSGGNRFSREDNLHVQICASSNYNGYE